MFVDSHCHLDYPEYAGALDDVIERARRAGVGAMLTIGTELQRFDGVRAIAERYERIWCSVGVHPHEAGEGGVSDSSRLVELARHPKVVAIGESGLDYYYEHSPRDSQQTNFRAHMAAAAETGLPLIVHTRDADEDTAHILKEGAASGRLRGVIHCFTSSRALAETALDLGFSISFSGIVTFKRADELRAIARDVPLDRMLVETDAPYLAPVPKRGKSNEPAFLVHTAAVVAELKGITPEALAEATTANFFRLFDKAKAPAER
ncbi:MAG: TatD family hydrolase [Alphaproteobacteria bacterium]